MYRPFPRLRKAEIVSDRALVDLTRVATSVASSLDSSPPASFGGRVWLLPKWYIFAQHSEWSSLLYLAELLRHRRIGRPRMYCAAKVFGGLERESGVRWLVGKGLPGILTTVPTSGAEDYLSLVIDHSTVWPDELDHMMLDDWVEVREDIRLRRDLEDAKRLKAIYGTAVGVSLRDPISGARIGCLTLHTSKSQPLSTEAAEEVRKIALTASTELSRQLCDKLKLTFRVPGSVDGHRLVRGADVA